MNEFFKFLKDKSFLSALFFILLTESFLQLGCYKVFLKKSSYAKTVNRVTDTAVKSLEVLKVNTIIMGTSIAYEGISPRILNEKLNPYSVSIQSIAIPGSEFIVQELALRKVLENSNDIKYVIHVNELQLPWVDRKELLTATLSMVSEFNRMEAVRKLKEDDYKTDYTDYGYLFLRYVAYRRDMADFILSPEKRLKDIGREIRGEFSLYAYSNEYRESMGLYKFNTIEDCIKATMPGIVIPSGSNEFHRDSINKTCRLAGESKFSLSKNESTDLYKKRLSNLYKYIKSKNIQIINVYPPVPMILDYDDYKKRMEFWESEYRDILSDIRFDLSGSVEKENNSDYYFDMIHLNQRGMFLFSNALSETLIQYFKEKKL